MKVVKLSELTPGRPRPGQGPMLGFSLQKNPEYFIGLAYYLPGGGVPEIAPDHNLSYYVLEGELTLYYDGREEVLGVNDSFNAFPGDRHRIVNHSNGIVRVLVIIGGPDAGPGEN